MFPWHGYWGGPWGFGWIFPLLGLVVMVLMILVCMRRMAGMSMCGGPMRHDEAAASEVERLRREIQTLRDELASVRRSSGGES